MKALLYTQDQLKSELMPRREEDTYHLTLEHKTSGVIGANLMEGMQEGILVNRGDETHGFADNDVARLYQGLPTETAFSMASYVTRRAGEVESDKIIECIDRLLLAQNAEPKELERVADKNWLYGSKWTAKK